MHCSEIEKEKFFTKTYKENDCLIWNGRKDKDGYGICFFRKKPRRAHRVAWFFLNGDIEEGLVVNHVCRRKDCVNPQHLQAMTRTENNMRDSTSIGYLNSQKKFCKNGHIFDKKYGKRRYCSICEREKTKRLRKKWNEQDSLNI